MSKSLWIDYLSRLGKEQEVIDNREKASSEEAEKSLVELENVEPPPSVKNLLDDPEAITTAQAQQDFKEFENALEEEKNEENQNQLSEEENEAIEFSYQDDFFMYDKGRFRSARVTATFFDTFKTLHPGVQGWVLMYAKLLTYFGASSIEKLQVYFDSHDVYMVTLPPIKEEVYAFYYGYSQGVFVLLDVVLSSGVQSVNESEYVTSGGWEHAKNYLDDYGKLRIFDIPDYLDDNETIKNYGIALLGVIGRFPELLYTAYGDIAKAKGFKALGIGANKRKELYQNLVSLQLVSHDNIIDWMNATKTSS